MDLAYLADLSPQEFERERCRLIGDELDKAPKEQRVAFLEYQLRLDCMRDTMTQDEFLVALSREMSESLENLVDQFALIKNSFGPPAKH